MKDRTRVPNWIMLSRYDDIYLLKLVARSGECNKKSGESNNKSRSTKKQESQIIKILV
jgi:hypothetical protein